MDEMSVVDREGGIMAGGKTSRRTAEEVGKHNMENPVFEADKAPPAAFEGSESDSDSDEGGACSTCLPHGICKKCTPPHGKIHPPIPCLARTRTQVHKAH